MSFEVMRERTFSASHQLRGYQGDCERLHGHNWIVRVHLEGQELDDQGMLLDFHELDEVMAEALAPFEHRHLNEVPPFDELNPSAENLARVIAERVSRGLDGRSVRVRCCDVWENSRSRARYLPG